MPIGVIGAISISGLYRAKAPPRLSILHRLFCLVLNGDSHMTNLHKLNKAATKLTTSVGVVALLVGMSLGVSTSAFADATASCNVGTGALSTECGVNSSATETSATAVGNAASAMGNSSTALGRQANAAGISSTALGRSASAAGLGSIALGTFVSAAGSSSTALGNRSDTGLNAIAVGGDSSDGDSDGAQALGNNSIVIGTDAGDSGFAGAIVIGKGALATEADQVILKSADIFTILGNGNMGLGTTSPQEEIHIVSGLPAIRFEDNDGATQDWEIFANTTQMGFQDVTNSFKIPFAVNAGAPSNALIVKSNGDVGVGTSNPLGNLDINSGAADTTLLLTNSSAQWELKSKASTGRLNFKNLTDGGVPFKLGPNSVNGLLSVGTMANDLVEVRGDLEVEGDVDVTGTLTTGGPTCGGGCDAVFGPNYDLPSIEEHAKAMYANSYLPEIGPTVPHAPVNLSEQYGRVINELEKAHIYIAQQEVRLARLEKLLEP